MNGELTEGISSNYVRFGEKSINFGSLILKKMLGNKKEETISDNSVSNSRYVPVTIDKLIPQQEKKSAFKFLNSPKKLTDSLNSVQNTTNLKNIGTKSNIDSTISEYIKQFCLKEHFVLKEKMEIYDKLMVFPQKELIENIITRLEDKSHNNSIEAKALLEILNILLDSKENPDLLLILSEYYHRIESLRNSNEMLKQNVDKLLDQIKNRREVIFVNLDDKEENKINLVSNDKSNSQYSNLKKQSCTLLEEIEENKSENSEIKEEKYQLNLNSPQKRKDKYGLFDLDLNTDASTVIGAKNNQNTIYDRNFPSSMPYNMRNKDLDNIWSNEEEFSEKKEEIMKNNKNPFDFVTEFI